MLEIDSGSLLNYLSSQRFDSEKIVEENCMEEQPYTSSGSSLRRLRSENAVYIAKTPAEIDLEERIFKLIKITGEQDHLDEFTDLLIAIWRIVKGETAHKDISSLQWTDYSELNEHGLLVLKILEKYLDRAFLPSPQTLEEGASLAEAYYTRNYAQALEEALVDCDNEPLIGFCYAMLGQYSEARIAYERALEQELDEEDQRAIKIEYQLCLLLQKDPLDFASLISLCEEIVSCSSKPYPLNVFDVLEDLLSLIHKSRYEELWDTCNRIEEALKEDDLSENEYTFINIVSKGLQSVASQFMNEPQRALLEHMQCVQYWTQACQENGGDDGDWEFTTQFLLPLLSGMHYWLNDETAQAIEAFKQIKTEDQSSLVVIVMRILEKKLLISLLPSEGFIESGEIQGSDEKTIVTILEDVKKIIASQDQAQFYEEMHKLDEEVDLPRAVFDYVNDAIYTKSYSEQALESSISISLYMSRAIESIGLGLEDKSVFYINKVFDAMAAWKTPSEFRDEFNEQILDELFLLSLFKGDMKMAEECLQKGSSQSFEWIGRLFIFCLQHNRSLL